MDITGRVTGYRGVAIRCPGCAAPMRAQALSEAEVDVCDSCGGLWLDWFDGEVRAVAREAREGAEASPAPERTSDLRNESIALGACPRCTRQLVTERYELPKREWHDVQGARASLTTGAEMLRCEECAGVFVSRTSAELLATLSEYEPPPPSSTAGSSEGGVLDPLPWQRFVAMIKRLLGIT